MNWIDKKVQIRMVWLVFIGLGAIGLLVTIYLLNFVEQPILFVQTLATVSIALTLIVYLFQLITMRDAAKGQNILALVNFLQDKPVRDARTTVIETLAEIPMSVWIKNEKYKEDASTVCSTYEVAAVIIRLGLVPPEPFVDDWGPSIIKCYEKLKPFIQEMQKPENAGAGYWDDFESLYNQAKRRHSHLLERSDTEQEGTTATEE